jgi:hypothetical protein
MKLYKKRTVIYREDNEPYLIRYTIFTCRWFSVKVHNILLSDYDCLHDHPWTFITCILKGGYIENTETTSKYYGPATILYRPANFKHSLNLLRPAWTLVITFRKVREWGFWTRTGWVHWRNYTSDNSCD